MGTPSTEAQEYSRNVRGRYRGYLPGLLYSLPYYWGSLFGGSYQSPFITGASSRVAANQQALSRAVMRILCVPKLLRVSEDQTPIGAAYKLGLACFMPDVLRART